MPRKYFRRKDKFLAAQFFSERYEELRELTRGRLYYDGKEDRYLLYTNGHDFIMKDGDYILERRHIDGGASEFEVWSEDVFETLFEIVPGQGED